MAKKVKKAERLKQISEEIKKCEALSQQAPDPQAESRVNAIIKNPCLEGTFYLNGILKEAKEEMSETAAMKYRSTKTVEYDFEEPTIEGWITYEQGLFKSDKLLGPFNSISALESKLEELYGTFDDFKLNDQIHAYLNADILLEYAKQKDIEENGPAADAAEQAAQEKAYEYSDLDENGSSGETPQTSDEEGYDVFSVSLMDVQCKFYYPTIKVLKSVENPETITTGIEGVPKCEKLFDWGKYSQLIATQKKIAKELQINNLEELSPYIFKWQFQLITGPKRVRETITFKTFKKNAFYPLIQNDLKIMEAGTDVVGLDGSSPCPKYFKETMTEEEMEANGLLSDPVDTNPEGLYDDPDLKQAYLALGGVWVKDSSNPIPTSEGGKSTSKYTDLWDKAISNANKAQRADELSQYEYDKETKTYTVSKAENPNWPYKALYIDTINYNYWENLRDQLQILYQRYSALPDEQAETDKRDPKQKDGKEYDPYCDKYFPLDYTKMLGLSLMPTLPFFNVDELIVDEKGKPVMEDDIQFTALPTPTWKTVKVQKKETHPVALIDGYGYVSTGIKIKLEYTGIPLSPNAVLIPGAGIDYGAVLAGYYRSQTAAELDKVKRFPYLNDQKDGRWFWLQCSFVSPTAIAKLPQMFKPGYKPLIVEFEVYQKFYLECGFPKKCGELTAEEVERNGKCGLEQFLSKPIVIDRKGFDPSKYEQKTIDLTKSLNEWKKKLTKELESSWDFATNLATNTWNKTVSMQNFMDIANQMMPGLDFLPTECKQSFCEAQRKAQGANSVKDMSDSLKNNIGAAGLLAKDMAKNAKDAIAQIGKGCGDFFSQAVDGAKNLVSTFNVYQLCPRRFGDWLKDAATAMGLPPGIDIFTQLQNTFTDQIMGGFSKLLNNCVTKNLTSAVISTAGNIANNQKNQLLGSFRSGNYTEFKRTLQGTNLKSNLLDAGTKAVNLATTINTPSFNMAKVTSLQNNMTRRIKSITDIGNTSDIFKTLQQTRDASVNTAGLINILNKELKDLGVK
jgi:hypothetical protein